MAPSCSSRKKGKKKVSVELVDVVGEDRISNLPDSILYFILLIFQHYIQFKQFFYQKGGNFFGLKFPLFVSMFGIKMRFVTEPKTTWGKICKLSLWISDAIAKNIKPLDLQTSYTEKTLESLKLCYLQVVIRGEVYLSRLHALVLSYVTFGDEEHFHKIVDGCLLLEPSCFIKIFNEWDFLPTILVSSRMLKKFDLTFSSYYKPMVFEIRAPSLEYLSISNCFKRKLILNSLPSLLEFYIDLNDVYAAKEVGEISYSNSITKLVQDVQHANSLSITQNTIKYFGNATTPLPKLTRLSKLAIKVICYQWNNILYLPERSVSLEVLILQKYFLRHGEVLEKIDVYVANNLNTKAHLEMVKKISVFCRLSPTCEVHLLKRNSGSSKKLMLRPLDVIPFDC
ncbi:hypothetical protein M9H77_23958 [Catharanthus roseus]|uniref:Uncharacterized protein n=1 Tax=Catharanthus roseus TaxID=4058 RepID=A0ACC0AWA5_CATRO|nr:hypothetical protein M9H77_23958 [Catharanthus roseus]